MPSPTAVPGSFESELEAQIEKDSASKINWAWLNLPITLWILSAVGISLLGFEFNGYSRCVSEKRTDNLQLSRLFAEMYYRRDRLSLLDNAPKSTDGLTMAVSALDPDTTYIFKNFKGRKMVELILEMNSIVYKWEVLSAKVARSDVSVKPTGTAPTKPSSFDLNSDYWTLAFQEFASSSGNVPAALLFDAQAAAKNNAAVDSVMDRVQFVAKTVKNSPDIAEFLSQQDLIQVRCFPRSLIPH